MNTRIKICGLRDTETISLMNGLPVHEIGLVLAPSKRRVDRQELPQLVEAIHQLKAAEGGRPKAVGVFVNASLDEISGLLAEAPLDVVQLHGNETPSYCKELKKRHKAVHIWRVFSIRDEGAGRSELAAAEARDKLQPYAGAADAFLLDAPGGGTGQPFNWSAIQAYKEAAGELGIPLYVAGGLHADNVQELLHGYSPDGIDVSSGVETDGRKDIEKIRLFVGKVLEA
ncbi:phosphoribosylanthranilate isomerase [Paenibacillus nanensis]|uniref:N-(5'-phosphoribosyl)anthranilate isomerase n=1 Tax=Paenibacillus nanensis TaxID=393251 RepID=A0A3A1V121_9BACL|nr:phosphoribosylanthranilate isomerase [Paenibacillus nanensis]RIX53496.1 phosphoribosylanthranilate isomerase [Paenibacillus nanensis]